MTAVEGASATPKERWSFSWKHLYDEVVTSGTFKLRNGAAVLVNNKVRPGNNPKPKPENS